MTRSLFSRLFSMATELSGVGKKLNDGDSENMSLAVDQWNDACEVLEAIANTGHDRRNVMILLAEVHGELGAVLMRKRETTLALAHYRNQLSAHLEAFGDSGKGLLRIYFNVATAAIAENLLGDAENHAVRGLRLSRKSDGSDSADVAYLHYVMCRIARKDSDRQTALWHSEQALALLNQNPGLLPAADEFALRSFINSNLS